MFPITVTISNPAQLSAVMAALNVDQINVAPATTAAPKAESKPAAKKAEEKKPEQVAETAQPAADTSTLVHMSASEAEKATFGIANRPDEQPTYQETADAVVALSKAKGRGAATEVLAKFGAAKLPEVKPEQFADVIAACLAAGA